MLRLRPITSRLNRRLTGTTVQDHASMIERLAPATIRIEPAALSLPGEIDRVVAYCEGLEPMAVRANMLEREAHHPPTLAYLLEDAVIADGCLYTDRSFAKLRKDVVKPVIAGRITNRGSGQLCSDETISRYFGDWLMTGLPLELLSEQRGLDPIVVACGQWANEPGYRRMLDLPPPPAIRSPTRFANMWVIDDRPMNDSRRARFETLRQRARRKGAPPSAVDRVFLERGTSGVARGLANDDAVRETLIARGFHVVSPETSHPDALAMTLSTTRLCVGVEGSALTHATMLMPRGGAILALQPPRRFAESIKLFSDTIGLRFGFVVGDDQGDHFTIPIDRLNATLDLVEDAIE